MSLAVVDFIRQHGLEKLKEELKIEVNNTYTDRITLNYDQIESPKHHPVIKECRGLILSWPNLDVLARSFDRFYNYSEDPNSKDFPIDKCWVMEKVDGSLISVYWDGQDWCCSTRKMAFAEGTTKIDNYTFRSLFVTAIGAELNVAFSNCNKDCTYVFELVSPLTRVVKRYPDILCYALAVRNRVTGIFDPIILGINKLLAISVKVLKPAIFKFDDIDKVINTANSLPIEDEGYVCTYEDLIENTVWRIKVKNKGYLAIAHMRGNGELSTKRIAYLVLKNETDEYLGMFPEDKQFFQPYFDAFEKVKKLIEELREKVKGITDQKEYAMIVKDTPAAGIMFCLKKGMTLNDIFEKMSDNSREELLNKFVEEK